MSLLTNIVAAYNLDESSGNATDSTGNGFTLTNNNSVAYAAGLIGNCANFGTVNTNKTLQITNTLGITGGPISIATWVKVQTEPIVAIGNVALVLQEDSSTHVGYFITYIDNAGTLQVNFNRQQQNTSNNIVSITGDLGTSGWNHLVLTYDGTTMKTYKNAVAGGTLACSGNGASGDISTFTIGGDTNGDFGNPGQFFPGYVDMTYVWSRAITSTEVTQLYNSGAGLQYPFTGISKISGVPKANILKVSGVAIASISKVSGVSN